MDISSIPKLGFGMMRLPRAAGEIDLEQTKALVDRFLAAGFRYFDTAYGYPGSEVAVGQALVARHPRESYLLASKLPAWAGPKTAAEAKAMFQTSLERTGAGYFDFYLLHNLGGPRTRFFDDYGLWDYVLDLKEKGLVRHVGFSFHDRADVLDKLLTAHPEMEFVQLQINYGDWEDPTIQSRRCYEVARRHKKPVIIMEPVKGGLLAAPPAGVERLLKDTAPDASCASWALRFAASLDGVLTVLSGMSDQSQLEDNLRTFSPLRPLTAAEQETLKQAGAALAALPGIPCTSCRYCEKDCPGGVAIPGILNALNRYLIYGSEKSAQAGYAWETRDGGTLDQCIHCGHCQEVCPQHIPILDHLESAKKLFLS